MKASDYIIDFLAQKGVRAAFGVTGGANLHLFQSVENHRQLKSVYNHHEQASALAAVAYSRVTKNIGAALVSTGPAGTNAITGLVAAWQDSVPCIFISGQTRLKHTTHQKPLRQIGSQELDIVSLVTPVTKYAHMISSPEEIRYQCEKAYYFALEGRPGPVWIDVPLDFQWLQIDIDSMTSFVPPIKKAADSITSYQRALAMIAEAQRPLIVLGAGCRAPAVAQAVIVFAETHSIPFVTSWGISDIVATSHPLHMGRIGQVGQRGGNLAIQNCDLVLALGTHLCPSMTGTAVDAFARDAKKIMVDIDPNEIELTAVSLDLGIAGDVSDFISWIRNQSLEVQDWTKQALRYRPYNSVYCDHSLPEEGINPCLFVDSLFNKTKSGDCFVVDGGGTNVYATMQSLRFFDGQSLVFSSGICAMGTGLPESIGAAYATEGQVFCFVGDGSFQFNIQELQTIFHHQLNILIFVFNNDGYLAIRNTQDDYFDGHYFGSDANSGVSLPKYEKVCAAYKIPYFSIRHHDQSEEVLNMLLSLNGPRVCELFVSKTFKPAPTPGIDNNKEGVKTQRPLEDMAPYLPREELDDLMIVSPWNKLNER